MPLRFGLTLRRSIWISPTGSAVTLIDLLSRPDTGPEAVVSVAAGLPFGTDTAKLDDEALEAMRNDLDVQAYRWHDGDHVEVDGVAFRVSLRPRSLVPVSLDEVTAAR